MSEETFSSNLPDLKAFINKLNLFDKNINKAVRTALNDSADMILAAQKQSISSKSQKLANEITKGKIYITKKGVLGISTGYQRSAFKETSNGKNLGVIGLTFEFGRPGSSRTRKGSTMKQKRGKKVVEVKKGTIAAVPHIRRGFDMKINAACNNVIEKVKNEIQNLDKG